MKPQHPTTLTRVFWYLFAVGLTLLVWYLIVPALAGRPGPREPGIDDSYSRPSQSSRAIHSISVPSSRLRIKQGVCDGAFCIQPQRLDRVFDIMVERIHYSSSPARNHA
jgi:hypothetical protein